MNDTISISVSDEERAFMDDQIAAGRYADDLEILHAALAALEREQRLSTLRELIAEGDADIARGDVMSFDSSEDFLEHIRSEDDHSRRDVLNAEKSGVSARQIPDIMRAVKTKLRANGSL